MIAPALTRACYLCGRPQLTRSFLYTEPPSGETAFEIPSERYRREFLRCRTCGLFTAVLDIELDELYSAEYVDATYGDGGLGASFERIMALPPERSDNAQRVRRVLEWFRAGPDGPRSVLDVGSGLAVFGARMHEAGWEVTVLDPDPRAAGHAVRRAGVRALASPFGPSLGIGRFALVTFNKVLEHVPDPVGMLHDAGEYVGEGGVIYVELPDGEMAAADPLGASREEFFIEHLWAFSMASLCLLADRAGFVPLRVERLREPSEKYTLTAFLRPRSGEAAPT